MNYPARVRKQLSKISARDLISRSLDLINPHLYAVEEHIRAQARAFDPGVEGYIAYACESKGKRLRPALALLSGGAAGSITAAHVDLAVIVELIHVATLVHDDIIDGAELRRSQPTANARWGSSLSVLLGDCLFSHALKLSTQFHHNEVSRRLADASVQVCSGEILQSQRRFDLKLSIPEYYRIIEMKTAALFAAAAELGAFLSDSSPERIGGAKQYGLRLGTAYQVYDDILDFTGTEETVGKTLRTDLGKGKLTLPLLLLLQNCAPEEQAHISGLILRADNESMDALVAMVRERGALAQSVAASRKLVGESRDALKVFSKSKHRDALDDVAAYLDRLLTDLPA